jgi:hypothetical protein
VLAEVDTVRVEVPVLVPLMPIEAGANAQVGAGVPPPVMVHDTVTVPVYPLAGVTLIVDVAVVPATTEPGCNGVALSA